MNYVVGFMFNENGERVALIRKTKPAWQAGLLNGIGGKVEEGETLMEAMEREFGEETGYYAAADWIHFGRGYGPGFEVHFFTCRGDLEKLESPTEEIVERHRGSTVVLRTDIVPNLRWILPMAKLVEGGPLPDPHLKPPFFADVEYFS